MPIERTIFVPMNEEQPVTFDVADSDKGPRAANVRPVA
jgi:cold shock CspA family protein